MPGITFFRKFTLLQNVNTIIIPYWYLFVALEEDDCVSYVLG